MSRSWVLLVLTALAGALLGVLMQSLPTTSDPGTFWVGNFSAPWAVLAFGAGRTQRSRAWAAVGGVAAEVAILAGFNTYALVGPVVNPWAHFGPPPYPGPLTVVATSVSAWMWAMHVWVTPAIGGGAVYGLLGQWWGRSRSIVAGAAIALPFLVEPVAWRIYDGFLKGPVVVWLIEIAVGFALLGSVLVTRRPLASR